jgi:hypothetical protein
MVVWYAGCVTAMVMHAPLGALLWARRSTRRLTPPQVFLVPTVVTYQQLALSGQAAGMPAELVAKVGDCVQQVGLAVIASGSGALVEGWQ